MQVEQYRQQKTKTSLFCNRDFMLLVSGFAVSTLGTSLSNLVIPILALAITHSPVQAGFVGAVRLAPYLFFFLPAGALIDRWNRKKIMITVDTIRFFMLASVPIALLFGILTIWQLLIVAFVEGIGHVFYGSAQLAALPRVVPPDQLASANAMNEGADSVAAIAGPGISGLIIGLARDNTLGAALGYLFDAITYLISAVTLAFTHTPFQAERNATKQLLLKDIFEGLKFLWHQRLLRILALLTTLVNFLQAPLYLTTVVFAQGVLHLSSTLLGLVFSIASCGTVFGALIASKVRARIPLGSIMVGALVVWALAALILAIANSLVVLTLGWLLTNITWPIYAVALVSYRLSITPDALQGRVNSAFRNLSFGVEPLGIAAGGLVLSTFKPSFLLWAVAIGLAACAICALLMMVHRTKDNNVEVSEQIEQIDLT